MNSRLIEIFLEIIAIDGVSGDERKVADYIIDFLQKLNLRPFEDNSGTRSGGNAGNLICKIGSGGDFVMLSHMDTARSTKGVKPQMLPDKITSDGTTVLGVDNRAGIACLLYSLETLIQQNTPVKDFTLAFTIQEETTLNGSRFIELDKKIDKGFVFDSHMRPGYFIFESAGSMGFSVKITGKAAHSGIAPEKGIDAIKIASAAINKIKLGRIDEDTTANIGIIKGGTATNVVPEEVFIEGEVRSMCIENIQAKIEEIKTCFETTAKEMGGKLDFTEHWSFWPYNIDMESETYKIVKNAITRSGLSVIPTTTKGGSDANSLNEKGIKCVNLGIGAENPHSNDEYIYLEDLESTARIAMEIMKQ